MSSSEVLKKFGRYFLLDHIAQGGMAEIFRARLAAKDGAGRLLVIKRIQTSLGTNAEFISMFKSEIKVTMGFNHPNIVQLYDFGEEENQLYIAIEFVDGKNLRQFLTRTTESKKPFPVDVAAYIIEQAAAGLHYAHTFKDKMTGQPLEIIHRDISPQNIILSYDGTVKVIDFGIAKATTNLEATRAGVIKGKPSYLSPEQITGETLDARCDIFALGIVLWEVLAGRKLFAGENDLAVLKLIEGCTSYVKPPSTYNARIPKELDYIVLRALTKQRDKRFQTAEDFQVALHRFLSSYNRDFNPRELSYFAKDLFKQDIIDDRKTIQRLNERVEQLLSLNPPAATTSSTPIPSEEKSMGGRESTVIELKGADSRSIVLDEKPAPGMLPSRDSVVESTQRGSSSKTASRTQASRTTTPAPTHSVKRSSLLNGRSVVTAAAAALLVAFFSPELGISIPILTPLVQSWTAPADTRLLLSTEDGSHLTAADEVVIQINGQVVSQKLPTTLKNLPTDRAIQLEIKSKRGSFKQSLTLKKGDTQKLAVRWGVEDRHPSGVASTKTSGPSVGHNPLHIDGPSIVLRLEVFPCASRAAITINGRAIPAGLPQVTVPFDTSLEIVVEKSGYRRKEIQTYFSSSELKNQSETALKVTLIPERAGSLTLNSTPSSDVTLIATDGSGDHCGPFATPIANVEVPAGTYRVKFENRVLGMAKVIPNVTVTENSRVNLADARLEVLGDPPSRVPSGALE